MSRIEAALNRLEARLRLLIEGQATGDGFPRKLHRALERELIAAMSAGARHFTDATVPKGDPLIAPDEYT